MLLLRVLTRMPRLYVRLPRRYMPGVNMLEVAPSTTNVLQLYIYKPNNAVAAENHARVFKYIYDFM